MSVARVPVLSLLLAATLLPACGPELDDADSAGDGSSGGAGESASTGEGESGSSGEASASGSTGAVKMDVSHEGEPCVADGAKASCTVDGADGLEICGYSPTFQLEWSACLTESCATPGAGRACEGGMQYCTEQFVDDGALKLWGVCSDQGECTPGETRDCGLEEFDLTQGCRLDSNGIPRWNQEDCSTPLVLSFGAELEFTPAPVRAADFDIHGGPGVCTRADWPSPATPWLALDRDQSGSIDGGHELFGSGTRLASGAGSQNGFIALAELDSDGDGKLSATDARWGELVLWADHDGDRRSSGWETLPLASFEVVEIELSYGTRRECDGLGNCGLERARFVYRADGSERAGEVIDVHLACE